jgi:hypothetical protein
MDLGTGITFGSLIISAGAIALKAIPTSRKMNGGYVLSEVCTARTESIEKRLVSMDRKIDMIVAKVIK